MTLEEAINHALERGEFVHLSVAATGKTFKATFASASRAGGYTTAEAADPIVAMVRAISATPMRRGLAGAQIKTDIAIADEAALS